MVNKKITNLIFIFTIFLLIFTGCNIESNQNTNKETIEIGGLFHLTGEGSFWGQGEKNGALIAIEEINSKGGINNKQLELIIEDSQTNFKQTSNAIKKLKEINKINIIIGPTWFGQVTAPLAKENNILMISPSTGVVLEPNDNFFVLWPTEKQEAQAIAKYIKKQNIKKIAIIYSLNDWSESLKNNFKNFTNQYDIKIIEEFTTSPDEKDFKTLIEKIKKLKIDAIYAPFAFYPSQGEFSKQLKIQNINITIFSSSGTNNPVLLDIYPQIENTIYPYLSKSTKEEEFTLKYLEKYNSYPAPSSAYAYDAIYLIAQALKNGYNTPQEISNYLKDIEYNGISNDISFDKNGRINHKDFLIKEVKGGEFIEVE